jgi:phage repressor protein C with HTH and peptisase S24 domain
MIALSLGMDPRDLIRKKISEMDVSLAYVSRDILKKNHAYLQQYLERGIPSRLPEDVRLKLADFLNVSQLHLKEPAKPANDGRRGLSPEEFDKEVERLSRVMAKTPPRLHPYQRGNKDRIPILGIAETGPDGWSAWNGDVVDTIPRTLHLEGAVNAYAVYITGTSMEPRYKQGELVLINPGKPTPPGSYVLVQRKPASEGEAPAAMVKLLARRHASKITLEQYNPPKTFDVKNDDIVSIHRVVGTVET